jgi:predicted acylesterase/phospholipase RssA
MARKTRRVFILGGGAALGAHQAGALKYLDELGIKPDAIVASSIGVINACAYASGGIPQLEEAWRRFRSLPLILSPSLWHNPLLGLSLFSADRLQDALEEFIDFPKIMESRIELEFILLNLSRGCGEFFGQRHCADWRELRTIMRAGYAIPFLFPPLRFRGDWYADGGFAWNVPLGHALTLQPTEIYVLAPIASELPYKAKFSSFFDFAVRVADVMWRTIGNMGRLYLSLEEGTVEGIPVTVIEPGEQWSGSNPLTIFQAHPQKSRILMDAGYRDAKRALAIARRARERKRAQAEGEGRVAAAQGQAAPAAVAVASGAPATAPASPKVVALGPRER